MFSLFIKTALRPQTARAKALGLLSFSLLVPLIVNAAPGLSLGEYQTTALYFLQNSQSVDGKKNFGFLRPGETVEQKMGAGETHTFQVAMAAGQYLRAVVEQKGIDIILKVLGPDGQVIREIDNPNGMLGPESVSVTAQVAGDYTLEISSYKTVPSGGYAVRIEALREPTPTDVKRLAAERLFAEAQELRAKGTKASREAAIEKYKEALAVWEALGDVQSGSYALCNIGRVFRALGVFSDSMTYLNRALLLLQDTEHVAERAFILNEIGATHRTLGDPLEAIPPYNQALELRRSIRDQWGQAQMLNNIGIIYWNTGYQRKAIENYEAALHLWQEVRDPYSEMNTRNNLGEAYAELSELSYAFDIFQQVLKFCQETGDWRLEAYVRNNIGKLFEAWAETQTALGYYEEALRLFQEKNIRSGEALVLNNIGIAHAETGDTELALEYLKKSLEIRQQLNEPLGISITLTNMGYVYALQKDQSEALKYFDLALPFGKKTHNKLFIGYALLSAGMAHASSGEPKKALEYYQQALDAYQEIDDRRNQAKTLDKMGQAYASLGELSKAFECYDRALPLWLALKDKQGQALTLYGIARAELDRNNLSASLSKIEQAVEIIESLRTKMTSQRLRLTYFATKQDFYALNIEVRMRLSEAKGSAEDEVAALHISERARARNFLDLLTEARADIQTGVPAELLEKNRELEREINALAESLMRLRNLKWTEKVALAEQRLNQLLIQHDNLQAKIRTSNKSYAELKQPQLLRLKEIQQLLDDETVLMEYALGEKQSYLWIVTPTNVISRSLSGRAEIERAVSKVRELLTAYEPPRRGESSQQSLARLMKAQTQYWPQAAELSRMVFGPTFLNLRAKRLVIVADGALQYIPFEALPIPDALRQSNEASRSNTNKLTADPLPLISQYEIIYEPSASALAQLRSVAPRQTAKTVAVLADPVFDSRDERMPKAVKNLPPDASGLSKPRSLSRALRDTGDTGTQGELERLYYSEIEANKIVAVAPAGTWMKAVGFKANRATATSPALKQYAIIHFATHGILDDQHPELSGLVLSLINEQGRSEDGFLRLHDIYNLDLSAELVVLSACRTGIGKQVRGEGLIGLTRGFMYAGAERVIASLWKVDDEATAELMRRFYRHLLKERKPAGTSLRLAQLEIMREREQWRAPYYWAGFILQGDWK